MGKGSLGPSLLPEIALKYCTDRNSRFRSPSLLQYLMHCTQRETEEVFRQMPKLKCVLEHKFKHRASSFRSALVTIIENNS